MNRMKKRGAGRYTITVGAVDEAGNPAPITEPVTVKILDGAGATVVEDVPLIVEGELAYDLDAALVPELDTYTAVWTGTADAAEQEWRTEFELVGGYLFEISDMRASRAELENTTKFPTAKLRDARVTAEQRFELGCHVAFVPRGARVELRGDGTRTLLVPIVELRRVYAVTVDGVAIDVDDLVVEPWGALVRSSAWPKGSRIAVHLEHGYSAPEGPVSEAVLELARDYVMPSNLPARATGISSDVGFMRFTLAGKDGTTGIPNVDAAIAAYGRSIPAVG